ncbi:2-amino-4-hydroxy-6-hydroxymethyldihydropteridine diphosphokinase [Dongia sp.]|uniref:2-amino-4-hydroxy-6- hydroxymethyldihydropteridine diphosphokinase n=1 Tax=Dongia sp. TaxID=1977262 RepID=UPI0035B33FC6
MTESIFIGLGANLPSDAGSPVATLEKAVADIAAAGIDIRRRSPWYESAPVPAAPDQPWYVNGVIEVATERSPAALLVLLQQLEAASGRIRSVANAARPLDLDIIAYGERVAQHMMGDVAGDVVGNSGPLLPHPRMQDRAFVLLPLQAIAPHWRHPVSGRSVAELIAALPAGQEIRLL